MVRKGDTLIEVCIAIGIFSLIAIGVASVMSSGTAGSQTALETTLTREEIDTQAEAIRFVHSAYMASKNVSSTAYTSLWNEITKNAIDSNNTNFDSNYAPDDCKALYDGNILATQHAFILNPRDLNNGTSAYISINNSQNKNKFTYTTTYPRLLFGSKEEGGLVGSNSTALASAEGIYVIAVKDPGTEMVVDSTNPTSTSAYYDFYIRSCWYGTDSERPSTISTVIRLYDPPASSGAPAIKDNFVQISFSANTGRGNASNFINIPSSITLYAGQSTTLPGVNSSRFLGWINKENNNYYNAGDRIEAPATIESNIYIELVADLLQQPFEID